MIKKVWLFLFLVISFHVRAQENINNITTIILVRHAEKADDGTKDPELSTEGKQRAAKLAQLLTDSKVDAIYSTNYKRTKNTVLPLSQSKGVEIRIYEPQKTEFINEVLKNHKGGTVVISGHSNTIPGLANKLVGKEQYQNFSEQDYDNILIVTVVGDEKNAKVLWLTY